MAEYTIRPLGDADREWVKQFITWQWGAEIIVLDGVMYHPETLPGFAAICGDEIAGVVTYHFQGSACEIVTLDSLETNRGIGTALVDAVKQRARQIGCHRLWLRTTNDNLNALRFYQKRGFVLAAIHPNALERSRKLRPEIPLVGKEGIPLRDEIELEMMLGEEGT
jgi:GNAT superfamily N-acetyltransferase